MTHKIKVKKADFKKLAKPMLREISFSGNMPSPYEKNLRKALDKKSKVRRKK